MADLTINDFVWVETYIEGDRFPLEVSVTIGTHAFFQEHLASTYHDNHEVARYGNSTYKVKIGDELRVGDESKLYVVVDISLEFIAHHPHSDDKRPLLWMKIILRPI